MNYVKQKVKPSLSQSLFRKKRLFLIRKISSNHIMLILPWWQTFITMDITVIVLKKFSTISIYLYSSVTSSFFGYRLIKPLWISLQLLKKINSKCSMTCNTFFKFIDDNGILTTKNYLNYRRSKMESRFLFPWNGLSRKYS